MPYYSSTSSIIASDGSVKPDGSMGASAVRLPSNAEDKYEVQSSSFTGPISSTSSELRGLTLAQTLIRPVDDTTILTDSLASLHAFGRRHRTDFQYFEEQHSIQPHLDQLVHQLNSKAAEPMRFGKTLTIAKIPGHAGDPMNEKADDLADRATYLPPDMQFMTFRHECLFSVAGDPPRPWSPQKTFITEFSL